MAFEGAGGLESIVVDASNPNYDSRNNCNAIMETQSNVLISGCKNTIIPDDAVAINGHASFDGDVVYELAARARKMSLTMKDWNDGSYDFALTPSTATTTISGSDDVVVTFRVPIPDVTVPQGGTAELTVGYTFTSTTDKVGFTFSLGLPDGISLAKDADGDLLYTKDATSIDKLNIISAGEGNIDGQPANENATIKGSSGTLLTLILVADASIEVGTTLTVPVTKATFQQRVNGSVSDINIEDFTFSIIVGEPDDGRIKFNETSATLPHYTAGQKGNGE